MAIKATIMRKMEQGVKVGIILPPFCGFVGSLQRCRAMKNHAPPRLAAAQIAARRNRPRRRSSRPPITSICELGSQILSGSSRRWAEGARGRPGGRAFAAPGFTFRRFSPVPKPLTTTIRDRRQGAPFLVCAPQWGCLISG